MYTQVEIKQFSRHFNFVWLWWYQYYTKGSVWHIFILLRGIWLDTHPSIILEMGLIHPPLYHCAMTLDQSKAPLIWRHNEPDDISNPQPHDCLLNRNSGADQRKDLSSVSLAFVGNSPVTGESPHKGPVTRKMLPFDDVLISSTHHMGDIPPFCTLVSFITGEYILIDSA